MEEGCLILGRRAEYRTDKDLYHIIQLQKIIENIETLVTQQNSEADVEDAYFRVRAQLEEFRAFMSADFSDSRSSKSTLFQVDTDCVRSTVHAIPHCQTIPSPSSIL